MKTLCISALAVLLTAIGAGAQSTPITIRAGRLLDGLDGVAENVTITVEGSRITRLDNTMSGPVTYDLSDLTVMPGWIDTHVHLTFHFDADGLNHSDPDETPVASYDLLGGVRPLFPADEISWSPVHGSGNCSGVQVGNVLRDETRGSSSLRLGRFSSSLVVTEIAVSAGLLVAAGFMVKSIVNLRNVDLGFETENVLTGRIGLPATRRGSTRSRRCARNSR